VYQALYRKWRPRRFDDVVGQEHITETLKRQVETERLSHAYLFTGTRGTGKTSCAKILAKAINCEQPEQGNPCNRCAACTGIDSGSIMDVLELDAASNNGVDQVRALRDEAVYTPASVKKRVYIIDEVHMLSTPAFNALLKILEEPPTHLMFILATTELHKVPATIKSRCQQFAFKRILPEEITKQLCFVSEQEGIKLSAEAARLLARLAEGGLRDALSLLDQCIGSSEQLTETDVLQVLGLAGNLEIARLLEHIVAGDTAAALERIAVLYREGKDMSALLGELSSLVRDLLIRKTAARSGEALLTGTYEESILRSFSEQLGAADLLQMLTLLQNATAELYRSSNRRTDVELCVIKLSEKTLSAAPEALLARISRLEEQFTQGASQPKVLPVTQEKVPKLLPQKVIADAPPWNESASFDPPAQRAPALTSTPEKATPEILPPKQSLPTSERAGGERDWKQFASSLRGKLTPSAYSFFSKAEFVTGVFEEKALRLYVDSDMTKNIVGAPEAQKVLTLEAARYTGRTLQVHLQVGKPEEEPQKSIAADKFNDLLKLGQQFENITIK